MPKVKKTESSSDDSDSGPEDVSPPSSKKSKGDKGNGGGSSANKADAPNEWTLEKLRRVRINDFRGHKMVDIREYYEKGGEHLPGKKGISLSITQWKKLIEIAPEVDKALRGLVEM